MRKIGKQIREQGKVDMDLLSETGKQTLSQIDAQKLADAYLVGIEAEAELKRLEKEAEQNIRQIEAGQQDRFTVEAQRSVDVNNITTQDEVDVDKIEAEGDQARQTIKTPEESRKADLERIKAQGLSDIGVQGAAAAEGVKPYVYQVLNNDVLLKLKQLLMSGQLKHKVIKQFVLVKLMALRHAQLVEQRVKRHVKQKQQKLLKIYVELKDEVIKTTSDLCQRRYGC